MFTNLPPFTLFHVILSLVAIVTGVIVVAGLLSSKRLDSWTAVFLATAVATDITGYFLPAPHLLPSHILGAISLIVLAVAIVARYSKHLAGHWRATYAVLAVVGLYLNVFVLIVQLFEKVDSLKALAPTQSEPPFAIAQGIALVIFALLAIAAARKFHPEAPQPFAARARA